MANKFNKQNQTVRRPLVCKPSPPGANAKYTLRWNPIFNLMTEGSFLSIEIIGEVVDPNDVFFPDMLYFNRGGRLRGPTILRVPGTAICRLDATTISGIYQFSAIGLVINLTGVIAYGLEKVIPVP